MRLPDDVYRNISSARNILKNLSRTSARTPRVNTSIRGRPSYDITQDQLQSLISLRFTVPQIAELLQISTRTIERRLAEYNMSARTYSIIADEELDNEVRTIESFHPNCGSKNLAGYLASRNIRVPRQRLRRSLQRVDPEGIAERRCRAIYRRVFEHAVDFLLLNVQIDHNGFWLLKLNILLFINGRNYAMLLLSRGFWWW